MPARLLDRIVPRSSVGTQVAAQRPAARPEPAYDALARLTQLRTDLAAFQRTSQSRWKEAPLFFFDPRRESQRQASQPSPSAEPFEAISARVAAELALLGRSVEVRRVARGIDGLRETARALAPHCPAAGELAELLAVPDDEVILVLHPRLRVGYRLTVQGVADIGQFHILMAAAIAADASDLLTVAPVLDRFVAACENRNRSLPAGVPLVMGAVFQLYTPAALHEDGTMPSGFSGCAHWLWPQMPLSVVPRLNGERMMLLGPPAYKATWDVAPRFADTSARVQIKEQLGQFRVAEELSRLTGRPIAPASREESVKAPLSRAA